MLKNYYALAKPGIIYGNEIAVIGGFFLASRGQVNFWLLIAALIGISLVIGSGCVFNNVIDRDIDGKMERTKKRELVSGRISKRAALIYGTCLGVVGFSLLLIYTNLLTACVALVGFFFYVVVYSLWAKRSTVYGTIIGAISGAVPPVVGYCAVSNQIDIGAILLFFILVFWQMPHFFAIAMYRSDEYAAAGIPVMPLKKGIIATKMSMLFYIIAFSIAAAGLFAFGYLGYPYLVVALVLSIVWLALCVNGFSITDKEKNNRWARQMFFCSLIVLVTLFATIVVYSFL